MPVFDTTQKKNIMSDLAKAYFRWFHGDSQYEWAQEQVEDRFDESLESALNVTLDLVAEAPSVESLGYIGAGQLEMLLVRSGELIFERLMNIAQNDKRLLFAMSNVYLSKDNPIYANYWSLLEKYATDLHITLQSDMSDELNLPEKLKHIQK